LNPEKQYHVLTLRYVERKEIKRTVVYFLHVHMSDT